MSSPENYPEIAYDRLLAHRRATDLPLQAIPVHSAENGSIIGYKLLINFESVVRCYSMWNDDENWADFVDNILPLCDAEVESTEVRFRTHDFSDVSDWDGRTHGDQVAYLAGGVMKHPIDGSWLNSTGAGMIAAYATPGNENYGNPAYLFGAYAHRITNVYDDVNYKWVSADGATRYAWLDTSVSPSVWKNDAGTTVVHYDALTEEWVRNDNDAIVTSSLWRILPYSGYKIGIRQVKSMMDLTSEFSGTLHYSVYMDLEAGRAGVGFPAGNYKVQDWAYNSLAELAAGSDTQHYIEPDVRPGHTGKVIILTYNYATATKVPMIDARLNMRLDISLSDNQPVTQTLGARATFICMKVRSF